MLQTKLVTDVECLINSVGLYM